MAEKGTQDHKWVFEENLTRLEDYDRDALVGEHRLGVLAFRSAPAQIERIISIVNDLREEDPSYIDDDFLNQVNGNLGHVVDLAERMQALDSSLPDAHSQKTDIEQALAGHHQWFLRSVKPRAIKAEIDRQHKGRSTKAETARARKEIEQLKEEFSNLQAARNEIAHTLQEQQDLVEAQRAAAGESGASELSAEYDRQASKHCDHWKRWLGILVVSVVGSIVAGLALFYLNRIPANATNAETATHITLDVYLIGLTIYAVRVASLQFRVHRHLEVVARSKSAALTTFSRIIASASEPEVRTALATVLAESVFSSSQSGFVGTGSDNITLVERVVDNISKR